MPWRQMRTEGEGSHRHCRLCHFSSCTPHTCHGHSLPDTDVFLIFSHRFFNTCFFLFLFLSFFLFFFLFYLLSFFLTYFLSFLFLSFLPSFLPFSLPPSLSLPLLPSSFIAVWCVCGVCVCVCVCVCRVVQELRGLVAMNESLKKQEQQFKMNCKVCYINLYCMSITHVGILR